MPPFLGVIHRGVGVLHEFTTIFRVARISADADAAGRIEPMAADRDRPVERFDELDGDLRGLFGVRGVVRGMKCQRS